MSFFLKTSGLVFNYHNRKNILDLLDIHIKQGEFVSVIGPNGSGKSTLLKCLNAILLPSGGRVIVDNMDTLDKNKTLDIRKTVGLVLQNPDNQAVSSIVYDDVAFGPENLGLGKDEIKKRVDFALKSVGMYEYRNKEIYKLSGGQKQKVALSGIIAMRPGCIILDEATSMLDPRGREEIIALLKKLNKEQNITIILVTQFMDEAALADRVFVMNNGKIVLSGEPQFVFSNVEELRGYGLCAPICTEFLYRLNGLGMNVRKDIVDVDECVDEISRLLEAKLCR